MKIELLERRRLLSVAVAQTSPGYFEIQGDDSPNPINVQVSQGDDSFTLDGVTYSNVNFISVFGNGGDDTINVQSSDGPGEIGAAIDGGAGNDNISLNFDGGSLSYEFEAQQNRGSAIAALHPSFHAP